MRSQPGYLPRSRSDGILWNITDTDTSPCPLGKARVALLSETLDEVWLRVEGRLDGVEVCEHWAVMSHCGYSGS